ncbi:hypothetical protein TSACC_22457 [Terrimicrobium sacchariphilum]|uniref:Uncharacterized protein n=1 Tax=Terrimicrobium sacchariphilum TaxID=690879 RepID=A0A146GB44_TERSA|nr:hypothetical protein TSACC_22457 [Terrimicrobium sacchariphilum]
MFPVEALIAETAKSLHQNPESPGAASKCKLTYQTKTAVDVSALQPIVNR